jgi:hypothetical protein
MSHNQFLIKKVNGGLGYAKGNKFGGPKSSNCETWEAKIAFKPISFYLLSSSLVFRNCFSIPDFLHI